MIKKGVILVLAFLLLVGPVIAEQTVKTVDIPLGYQNLVNPNVIQQYNFTVDFPDGIDEIISLEFLVNADYLSGTKTYGGVIVQGIPALCNPSEWTTYFDGRDELSFDCSQLVRQANWKGHPTIPLEFTFMSDNFVGNIKPRVKMTYYNNPDFDIIVHGTEYSFNDEGKIFIQLLDDNDQPITDADCFASIYYPNNDIFKFQQAMVYVDEGIYDFDFTVPAQIGVYPVSSFCVVDGIQTEITIVTDDFESGDGTGGANWSSDWELNGAIVTTDNAPFEGVYHLEIEGNDNPKRNRSCDGSCERIDYSFVWKANGLANTEDAYVYLIDSEGTEFEILFIDGQGDDDNTWRKETGSLSTVSDGFVFNNNTDQIFEVRTSGDWENGDFAWFDDIELTFGAEINSTDTNYQIVRGSGEVHVTNEEGEYITELIQGELTFDGLLENFTFVYEVTSLTSQNKTGQDIKFTVWKPFPCNNILSVTDVTNTPISYDFTGFEDSDDRCEITIEAPLDAGATYDFEIVSQNQWKKDFYYGYSASLLEAEMINISCNNYIQANGLPNITIPFVNPPNEVWNASGDQTTPPDAMWLSCASYLEEYNDYSTDFVPLFFQFLEIDYNFSIAEMEVLEAQFNRMEEILISLNSQSNTIFNGLNLGNSYSLGLLADPYPPDNPDYATYFASISSSYLNYVATQGVPTNVWNYVERNLTSFDVEVNATVNVNTTEIAEAVWSWDGSVASNILNQVSTNVWSFSNRSLTGFNNLVSQIWNYNDRNLTYIDGDYIASVVWNDTNRSLTSFDFEVETFINYTEISFLINNRTQLDQTNYDLIQSVVWNATNRSLTSFDYVVTVTDVTNYTEISFLINNRTQDDTVDYTIIGDMFNNRSDLTNYTEISFLINNRTQIDLTDYDLIQEVVWNATNRSLTNFDFVITVEDVTNYTEISFLINNRTDITDYDRINDSIQNRNDIANYTYIQELVWTATERTLTDFNFTIDVNQSLIAETVWEYVNRTLTDATDVTDYDRIQEMVWNATDRTLTELNFTVETTVNNTEIARTVWNYIERNLTTEQDNTDYTLIQAMVWNATDRTLTEFDFTVTATFNETALAESIWNYNGSIASNILNQISTNVWSFGNRTVTGFNNLVDQIWNFEPRNVTTIGDNTDYEYLATIVWNSSQRNLTYYGDVNTNLTKNIENFALTFLGETEYMPEDPGKVVIRLIRGTGELAELETGADCNLTILYPNNSYWIENITMSEFGRGIYSYNFTVPETLGVYTYASDCIVDSRKYYGLETFHVYQNIWEYEGRYTHGEINT